MANEITVQISFDPQTGELKSDLKKAEKVASKSGKKAGKKFEKNFSENAKKGIDKLKASFISFAAVTASGVLASRAAIRAAQVQEDAINSLNVALSLSKNASLEASQGLQSFASELQKSTRFGDEVLLQNAALIQSLGDLDEKGLKRALRATTDLATALRVDLNTAATLVGKAAAGEVGTFSRYGLSIKKGATNTETFAKALTAIEGKFGGAAQKDIFTYSGAVDQLSNAFGDTLEAVGRLVTENPKFVSAVKKLTDFFVEATNSLDDFAKGFDLFDTVGETLVSIGNTITNFVIPPLELFKNVGSLVASAIIANFNNLIASLGNVGFAIAQVLDKFGIGETLSKELKVFEESSEEVAVKSRENFTKAFDGLLKFPLSEKLFQKNEEMRAFFQGQKDIVAQSSAENSEALGQALLLSTDQTMSWGMAFQSVYDEIANKQKLTQDLLNQTNERMKKFAKDISTSLRVGVAQGAGQAFAAFGRAVATGENALSAFTKVLFKTLADQSVALGTKFILEGSAMLFSVNPADNARGPFLIKAGAALAAFGGFIGATAGGGGAAGGATAQGGGTIAEQPASIQTQAPEEIEQKEQTNVNVTFAGPVFDSEQTGKRIVDLINKEVRDNNTVLVQPRFV